MKRTTTVLATLLVLSLNMPAVAAAPDKFEKDCVKLLSKSERRRLHGEHETYCHCVTEAGQRLGLSRKEFAIERERLSRDPDAAASGRMRQISNLCRDGGTSRAAPAIN